ncbi:MAG: hypothetical protein K2X69_12200 [Silvanigrellaceae bacterium]|nr:hypothetical protein [Silvanigrellaceae bacterium]
MLDLNSFKKIMDSLFVTKDLYKFCFDKEIQNSLNYLSSKEALLSIEKDPYWPKWNSPWWHMSLLHEMNETKKIPDKVILKMITALNNLPIQYFPIYDNDLPININKIKDTSCHCALGNMYQIIHAYGVDVDKELPWIKPWFFKYQMLDGGLNCDEKAYHQTEECPSSMVGTIAAFEAVLLNITRIRTAEEIKFLDKGAQFLLGRQLMFGSKTRHNAEEQESEKKWLLPCFPRFYHYDVLRGLNALLNWSLICQKEIPLASISPVTLYLVEQFSDGLIRNLRLSYIAEGSYLFDSEEKMNLRTNAELFPLLKETSMVGNISPYLSEQWNACKSKINLLLEKNLILN